MATKRKIYTAKTAEEKQQEIEQLTKQLESKIESYFESSENMLEHLKFMSNFHNYSVRNMSLINAQFRGAKAVGSFKFWQSKGVHVKKGEKGIKILVPTPVEFFKRGEDEKGNPIWIKTAHANAKEQELIKEGQLQKKKVLFFKIGHVFEYTQTDARENGLEVSEIFGRYHREGTIENDREFLKAFEKLADEIGVKILEHPPIELGTAKGAFFRDLNAIALNPRNSLADSIPVMIHELAHAELHNLKRIEQREKEGKEPLTTSEKEFQAEMISYVVASRYDISAENFSLPYLAGWTKGVELKEKAQLLEEVRERSSTFIDIIDQHFEQEKLLVKQQDKVKSEVKKKKKNFEYER